MSWHNESRRHSLASRGIKTAIPHKPVMKVPTKKFNHLFKEKAVEDYVMELKKNGFRVFVMEDSYNKKYATNWGIFSKDDKIGYFQYDGFRGFSFSTRHKPNRLTGTGFQISSEISEPTIKNAEETFVNAPYWAKGIERTSGEKYQGINDFMESEPFNKNYIEVV